MGGGGVVRSVAKVAGIGGVVHGGMLRGAPGVSSPTGHSVRKASIPVAATLTAQNNGGAEVAAIEKLAWDAGDEFVDWQVVGAGEDDLVMSGGEPMPRVVFDAAPSFKEAKEATAELKDALDKVYLSSPKSTDFGEVSAADNVAGLSLITHPEPEEMESLLLTRTSVPKHALHAFEMLSRSSEAQNVVASIASDPNIWNAMMENSAVKQFMANKNYNRYMEEYAADTYPVSHKKLEDESEKSDSLEDMLGGFVQKIKLTVEKWVSDLSSFIQNIFEPPAAETKADGGNTKSVVASAFMGLAVMVVMVVLLKRA
ncbi:hypothetical protein D8674_005543 [Pyrus ussuriensis x Pyrus communis]|uniref:Uncharacterized protein n=1 Tax=Pyrus ussuriensis x Pyrus communis TaxID=2448454 RepID=A0A5N5FRR5_9ROSA|nr:hypothetical protein D8674_005543 [Pyrus ussuriensis x Pyrus communis]